MKKIILLIVLLQSTIISICQNAGIGTAQPQAALDITSTTKGILLPRLTGTQMNNIANPANSLLVFNSTTNSYWYYKTSTGWVNLSLAMPLNETASTSAAALKITNNNTQTNGLLLYSDAANGNAVFGQSATTYPGVQGYNTSTGISVYGENSGTGHGVHARGKNLTGLFADIPAGTGNAATFKNNNANGTALEVEGNMAITGGNTDPNFGYVLTAVSSDGTSVWKPQPTTHQKVAFEARGMAGSGANVMYGNFTSYKYHPANIIYNPGSDFKTISQSPSSTFVVPKAGLYEFKAMITFPFVPINYMSLDIKRERNGLTESLGYEHFEYGKSILPAGENIYLKNKTSVSVSTTAKLLPGDKIWVELAYSKDDESISTFDTGNEYHYFSGIMLWED